MVEQRCHPALSGEDRLNLLVSYAGWEDESWADRLPRLLEPMGVRAVRAKTGREAQRLLQRVPVHIAVVDLSLPLDENDRPATPSEGGKRLLEILARMDCSPALVVVKRRRSARDEARELSAALDHGAFAAVDPPVQLEAMLEIMRRILAKRFRNRWPRDTGGPTAFA